MAKKKEPEKQEPAKKGKAPRVSTPGKTGVKRESFRTCGKPIPAFDGYAVYAGGGSCTRRLDHPGRCGT